MSLEVFPVKATRKQGKFDLYNEIKKLVEENGVPIRHGDVIVVSSKYVSNSQGRISVSYTHLTLPTILLV